MVLWYHTWGGGTQGANGKWLFASARVADETVVASTVVVVVVTVVVFCADGVGACAKVYLFDLFDCCRRIVGVARGDCFFVSHELVFKFHGAGVDFHLNQTRLEFGL